MAVDVRESTKQEISAQLAILREEFPKNIERDEGLPPSQASEKAAAQIARLLGEGSENHFFTIEAEAEAVGYYWLRPLEEELFLIYLYVSPEKRRQGFARFAMSQMETFALEKGYPRLGLYVFGGNTSALALYESCGWSVTNLRMVKRLGQGNC